MLGYLLRETVNNKLFWEETEPVPSHSGISSKTENGLTISLTYGWDAEESKLILEDSAGNRNSFIFDNGDNNQFISNLKEYIYLSNQEKTLESKPEKQEKVTNMKTELGLALAHFVNYLAAADNEDF